MRSLIKLVLAIVIAWFTIVVVIPALLLAWLLYFGSKHQQEKEKEAASLEMPVEAKQNYCIDILYSKSVDSYTNKTYLTRVKSIDIGYPTIEYRKSKSGTKEEYLNVNVLGMLPTEPIVSIELAVRARDNYSNTKAIKFRIHGSEEEISLDVSTTEKGAYYIDFSKGSKNYEELLKVTPEGSIPKLRASSMEVTGKKSTILLTADVKENRYRKLPLLLEIRRAVDCITNPPEIPKEFTVVE